MRENRKSVLKSRIVRNGDPWDRNEKKFVGKIKGEVCLKDDNSFRKKKKSVD